ncbi:MAG: hypothetical protein IID52_04225 [Proteobacteria bacterium]|nr:hypothetical protein [Pseudomonadota bacterium]
MKKFLKIAGVLFLGAIGIGVIWYFQSLKIEGDPLLTACWGVEVYDDLTGEKVVGVEDLDFDPATGTIFLSAYDRRAVAREIDEGKVTTQGGIYTINVSDITDATSLQVTDISRAFKEAGNEFRPHGFSLGVLDEQKMLMVINRTVQTGDNILIVPKILLFSLYSEKLNLEHSFESKGYCDLYDVVFKSYEIVATNDLSRCYDLQNNNLKRGELIPYYENVVPTLISSSDLPNGIAYWGESKLVYSETKNKELIVIDFSNGGFDFLYEFIKTKGFPDNLTVDETNNLIVAVFPNLIDYFFFMKSWIGVNKSPSAAYRISPETYEQTLLFKDDGAMISGATVALRAGDYLILGSGWDDHIAICSGMDGLD